MPTIREFAIQNKVNPARLAKQMIKVRSELIANRKRENKWVIAYMAMSYIKCKMAITTTSGHARLR